MTVEPSSTVADAYDLLESGELWQEFDGQWKATGTGLVYRKSDGQLYYGWSSMTFREYSKPGNVPLDQITREILIPIAAYCPPFQPSYTQATDIKSNVFVKTHPLQAYDWLDENQNKGDICETVLRELNFCERLKRNVHPHLAEYMGCQVTEGKISGLCFKRYKQTLQAAFNPENRQKRETKSPGWSSEKIARCLDPIESALRHLHSLNIVHNDVNPANIMFDQDENPVLIDFGSCCQIGQSLEEIGRTYEWYDERVNTSLPSNDLDAIQEIREWLSEKDTKKFRF